MNLSGNRRQRRTGQHWGWAIGWRGRAEWQKSRKGPSECSRNHICCLPAAGRKCFLNPSEASPADRRPRRWRRQRAGCLRLEGFPWEVKGVGKLGCVSCALIRPVSVTFSRFSSFQVTPNWVPYPRSLRGWEPDGCRRPVDLQCCWILPEGWNLRECHPCTLERWECKLSCLLLDG